MHVVQLARYKNRQTVEVLEALATKARAGEITGVALCYRTPDGFEDSAITGNYAASPDTAAAGMLRLSVKIASARGEYNTFP